MQRRPVTAVVRVQAPARLHLGFLDLNGDLGRRFGSLGLAISEPVTELTLGPSSELTAQGLEQDRALTLLARLTSAMASASRYRAVITRAIPPHAGLGSGTQLALAIGAALTRLEGLEWDERSLGALVERGARSAIGMAAFTDGGFVVDGGRRSEGSPPPVVARARFPDAWRILLILDPSAQGVHGDRETQAFATLPEFPAATSGHLCRLILLRLLPGLHETDIGAFGSAISEIQEIIGVHFAAVQGGSPWSSPKVGAMARRMAEAGAAGIGQSSWGPTGFALAGSEAAAARLYSTFVEDATAQGLEIRVVRGRNSGATIEWHDKPSSGA